ncbi:MAG: aminotransferase class V-fold PLP-dependent enzyme [Saprospiraceae bacterium]
MFGTPTFRQQFPIFQHHPTLVYLDSAATTQKPNLVIDGITNFYQKENANIHRGIYDLAAKATQKYESVRQKVANFIGANHSSEIVYTSGTTAAINLVANSFLMPRLAKGDEVLVSAMEHHANLLPWQMACKAKGANLRIIPIDKAGNLDMTAYQEMLSAKTKMVAVVHISNTLATINPIVEMIELAHQQNIPILVDGAQSTAHYPIDVATLGCDFFTFSGHKIFGPTGIGVLYGKTAHLTDMSPYQFGGDMIRTVTYQTATFAPAPQKFEAGTTNIAGVIGLGYAIDFMNQLDKKSIATYVKELGDYARERLLAINDLRIIGNAKNKTGIVSFVLKNAHPHDVATFLGAANIAIRAGHHCTQPLMDFYEIPATSRASFSIYNNTAEVDFLVEEVKGIQAFFA